MPKAALTEPGPVVSASCNIGRLLWVPKKMGLGYYAKVSIYLPLIYCVIAILFSKGKFATFVSTVKQLHEL
jgi:hypothetical protein